MKSLHFRAYQHVLYVPLSNEHFVEGALLVVVRREVQSRSGVGLRVGIYYQDLLLEDSQGCG